MLEPWALPRSVNPAGGLVASVDDMLRYARFHLGDGTTEWQTGAQRREPAADADAARAGRLGAGSGRDPSRRGRRHLDAVEPGRGADRLPRRRHQRPAVHVLPRSRARLRADGADQRPELGFCSASKSRIGRWTGSWGCNRRRCSATVPVDPARLAEYSGEYALPDGSEAIRIRQQDGGPPSGDLLPVARARTGRVELPLRMVGEDLAMAEFMGVTLYTDFVRDDAGKVAWVRFLGRLVPARAVGAVPRRLVVEGQRRFVSGGIR